MWRCTMITKMHSCEPITKTSIYMTNGIHKIHLNDWHGIWPHGAHSIGYNFSTSLKQQELPSPTTFRSEPTCYIEKFSSGENNTQNAIIQLNSKNFQPIGMVIYVQQTKRNFQIEENLKFEWLYNCKAKYTTVASFPISDCWVLVFVDCFCSCSKFWGLESWNYFLIFRDHEAPRQFRTSNLCVVAIGSKNGHRKI